MNRLPGQRVRLRYGKDDLLKYIGHTDLLRLLMRLLQRAEFPYGQSGHFSPKPRISYSPALPLGVTAQNELCEIELREEVSWEEPQAQAMLDLLRQLEHPPGLIRSLELLPMERPSLAREAVAGRYYLEPDGDPAVWLAALQAPAFGWTRRNGDQISAASTILRSAGQEAGLVIDSHTVGPAVFHPLACAQALATATGGSWRTLERSCLLDAAGSPL